MNYDPRFTDPMREELTSIGVSELRTAADVDAFLAEKRGTALVVVNSVCGCAAGMARPGLKAALASGGARPDRVASVFAGVDREATARARESFGANAPSSPSFALFRDGELFHFVPRWKIEGRDASALAQELTAAFASAAPARRA